MKKICIFMLICVVASLLLTSTTNAEMERYIRRGSPFTELINVGTRVYHSDDIVYINTFYEVGSKLDWKKIDNIVSYRYLGIDNDNNLHIERREKDYTSKTEDRCSLIFKLNSEQTGTIVLIGKRSQKEPLLIELEVKATNLGMESKYLGDLPEYEEE